MAFIADFLNRHFGKDTIIKADFGNDDTASAIYANEVAFNVCVNMISNAISKCDINVYDGKGRVKDHRWYLWNTRPNVNQSSSEFWNKLIYKLYNENEVLVIPVNGSLYIADSFTKDEKQAFYPHTFSNIQINDMSMSATYTREQAFYFKLNNNDVKQCLDNLMGMYSKMINNTVKNYNATFGNKGFLHISKLAEQNQKFKEKVSKMFTKDFKNFFNSDNAVMPLYDGYEYEKYQGESMSNTRDITALINDTFEIYARAFGIPKVLITGEVQDTSKAMDAFLTLCIDPLIELLQDEINSTDFSEQELMSGRFVRFDTTAIKHIDLLDVATSIDKLISSGFVCINDLHRICHLDLIEEDWANEFFMTKNYSRIEDIVNGLSNDVSLERDNE